MKKALSSLPRGDMSTGSVVDENGPDACRKTYLNNIYRVHTNFSLLSADRDMQPPVTLIIPVNIRSTPPNSQRPGIYAHG